MSIIWRTEERFDISLTQSAKDVLRSGSLCEACLERLAVLHASAELASHKSRGSGSGSSISAYDISGLEVNVSGSQYAEDQIVLSALTLAIMP